MDSKHVVIMKLHTSPAGLKADQALAFMALVAEVMESGYHFFILHERVSGYCYVAGTHRPCWVLAGSSRIKRLKPTVQVEDIALTRWQALKLLPRALHPFVIFHNFAEASGTFDLLKKQSYDLKTKGDPGPGDWAPACQRRLCQ